jgi:hypothetical protein
MATYVLCPLSTFMSVFNNSGLALTNGLIWTYAAGTSTPTPTWTDSTGGVQNSNPIQLTVGGNLSNVNIYQQTGVKIKVQFSTNAGTVGSPVFGTQIGPTFDNVIGIGDSVSPQTTYYGGTDTGSANAYLLTFSANFTSYVNGTIIYWVPSHTNTGASTLNVNGLGALNITYPNGNALAAGQLQANQIATVAVSGGAFVYIGPVSSAGLALFTFSGFSGTVTANASYSVAGNVVTLRIPQTSGTSSSTSFSMQSFTPGIFPPFSTVQWAQIQAAQDNGSALYSQLALVTPLGLPVSSVVITLYKNNNATGWTSTGTKGIGDGSSAGGVIVTYLQV